MKIFNFFSLLFSLLLSSEVFSQNVLVEMQATPAITRYDAAGNLYVVGRSERNGSIGATNLPSYGATDVFLAKFGFGSTLLWVKVLGGTGDDDASYLGFTPNGNIDIAFNSSKILDLDPGTGTVNTTQDSTSNVVTFDPNGNYVSSKTFGYNGWVAAIQYSGTTVNYIGNFSGRFDADYSTGISLLTQPTTASDPGFFAHYENNTLVYASIFDGKITGFNTDYAGDLLLTLQVRKPFDADFRLGTTNTITPPTTNYHPCLMRVKTDGSLVWAKVLGTQLTSDDYMTLMLSSKPNNGNNIVIGSTYRYGGDIDPSPTNTVNISSTYSFGSFVAVFNSNGDLVGSKNFNKGVNVMGGIIPGNQGESLIHGFFVDTMVLSPSVQLTHRGKTGSFGGFASVLSSNFTPSPTSQFYYGNGADSRMFVGDRYDQIGFSRYALPGVAADTCDFDLTSSSRGQVINKGFIIEPVILTSNENVSNDNYTFVYPNPANDWLNLNFEPVGAATIVNILGQKQEATVVDGKIQISTLEKGIYWLTVDGGAFKFIKE
jgi:hypothetical protein